MLGVVALAIADQVAARFPAQGVVALVAEDVIGPVGADPVKSAAPPFLHFLIVSSFGRESPVRATQTTAEVRHKAPRGGTAPTPGVALRGGPAG